MNDFPNQEGKLNLYFHISENSGVGYYRQFLPALKLREHALANVMISDFRWGEGDHVEPDINLLFDIMNWTDLVIVGRKDQPQFYAQWGGIKEFFKLPIVMDTDDNVRHVRPHNPGYQGYHPGSDALIWNKYGINKVFDAITVSTTDLYDIHSKENPKTFILPNNLDIQEWEKHEIKKWNDGKIRLGFIGSSAHTEGIQMIKKPLVKMLKKYPQTLFFITHTYMHLFEDTDVKGQLVPIPWIKLQEWPQKLREQGIDIGLAPLADNLFNRAKSNLRWLEFSLAGMAPIVSPVKPYLCVRDGIDGLIAKEEYGWYHAMERLIEDADFRNDIATNAYDRVVNEYDIDKNIGRWYDVYENIHRKYYEFFDPKNRFMEAGMKGKQKRYKQIIGKKQLLRR